MRCILLDDTFVEPFSGVHFKSLGGVVSLGPPCGPLPRLAQPRIVKIEKMTNENIGQYLENVGWYQVVDEI